jgi:hypothetical protein
LQKSMTSRSVKLLLAWYHCRLCLPTARRVRRSPPPKILGCWYRTLPPRPVDILTAADDCVRLRSTMCEAFRPGAPCRVSLLSSTPAELNQEFVGGNVGELTYRAFHPQRRALVCTGNTAEARWRFAFKPGRGLRIRYCRRISRPCAATAYLQQIMCVTMGGWDIGSIAAAGRQDPSIGPISSYMPAVHRGIVSSFPEAQGKLVVWVLRGDKGHQDLFAVPEAYNRCAEQLRWQRPRSPDPR